MSYCILSSKTSKSNSVAEPDTPLIHVNDAMTKSGYPNVAYRWSVTNRIIRICFTTEDTENSGDWTATYLCPVIFGRRPPRVLRVLRGFSLFSTHVLPFTPGELCSHCGDSCEMPRLLAKHRFNAKHTSPVCYAN
jgi:hypothetical protein